LFGATSNRQVCCSLHPLIRSIPLKGYGMSGLVLIAIDLFGMGTITGCLGLLGLLASSALAQTDFLKKGTFEGAGSVTLSNGALEMTILNQGATLANLAMVDDPGKLSPLWNPMRMAKELGNPGTFNGTAGHFVSVDGFGPVSPQERASGLPGHGEAHW